MMFGDPTWGMHASWLPLLLIFFFIVIPARRGARRQRRGVAAPPRAAVGEDRALAVLRERYARGEIDRTEYEERRATLLEASRPAPPAMPESPEPGAPPAPPERAEPPMQAGTTRDDSPWPY